MSVVEYKETSDGSFIDISDEPPQENVKQAKTPKQAVEAKQPNKQKKQEMEKEAVGSGDADIFSALGEPSQQQAVDSGDSALNDFLKNLQ